MCISVKQVRSVKQPQAAMVWRRMKERDSDLGMSLRQCAVTLGVRVGQGLGLRR